MTASKYQARITTQGFAATCCTGIPLVFRYGCRRVITGCSTRTMNLSGAGKDKLLFAFTRLDRATNRLLIHFIADARSPERDDILFVDGYFRLQEEYRLPDEVGEKLGLAHGAITLSAGKYPVLTHQSFHTVSVSLAKHRVYRLADAPSGIISNAYLPV